MAIPEVCAVWIEQRIEEEMEDGNKSLRAIGREIAKEVEKHFEQKVNPETIRKRASRMSGTFVPPPTTPLNDSGNQEMRNDKGQFTQRPEGSGRKPKYHRATLEEKEAIVSDAFETAYQKFFTEIKNAKALKWNATSKEAVLRRLEILYNVTTIE